MTDAVASNSPNDPFLAGSPASLGIFITAWLALWSAHQSEFTTRIADGSPSPDLAARFRSLAISISLPISDAFTSDRKGAIAIDDLNKHYSRVAVMAGATPRKCRPPRRTGSVPMLCSEAPIGLLSLLMELRPQADKWVLVDGVASAVPLRLDNQRPQLIGHWRRAAPLPHREFDLTDRLRKFLFMVGAASPTATSPQLECSIPTIKKAPRRSCGCSAQEPPSHLGRVR